MKDKSKRAGPVSATITTARRFAAQAEAAIADLEERVPAGMGPLEQVGNQYGYVTIVSIALGLLTSGRLTFGLSGTEICSGLARMLERGTYSWVDPPSAMPADLARFFDAPGPS